jgi:transcriptional regulator with XRE-family HTH domain
MRQLRKARNLSQAALALEAGLDRTYISLLELGQRSPTLDTIMLLAPVLGVSLTEMASKIDQAFTELSSRET